VAPDGRRTASVSSKSPASVPAGPPILHVVAGGAARASKIRDVRARILAGYYDRLEVRSRLADAVLRTMRRG